MLLLIYVIMSFWSGLLEALPVIGPAVQSVGEARTQRRNVDRTIAANKELAEYQYSKDLEMWNRQNQYNSPEAQMARLKGAGLNPNLVYGQGAAGASGQAREMPKYNAPTVQYDYKPVVDLPAVISQFQDFQMRQAQIDNLRSQKAVIDHTGVLRDVQSTLANQKLGERASLIPIERELKSKLVPYQLDYASLRNKQVGAQIDKLMSDTRLSGLRADWYTGDLVMRWLSTVSRTLGIKLPGIGSPKRVQPRSGGRATPPKVRYNSPTFWRNLKR